MSQVTKKVDWCLRKAEKELAEEGKHRGLVKINPNKELAGKHLAKAQHNLEAAYHFTKTGYSDWSPSAFFYSTYHCFLSILSKFGYETKNQECTIAAIEMLNEETKIDIDDRFIKTLKIQQGKESDQTAIELREDFQYGVKLTFEQMSEFDRLGKMCKELIDITREIVTED
jgi:uncharacterized protein (UPF0332 family)